MEPKWESGGEIVWRPSREQAEGSRLYAFMRKHGIATFDELMRRSTEDIEEHGDGTFSTSFYRWSGACTSLVAALIFILSPAKATDPITWPTAMMGHRED